MEKHQKMQHISQGKSVNAGGIETNYQESGSGQPIILLHGSGAGVSGWENWRFVIPELSRNFHVFAPDIVGFGLTQRPEGIQYGFKTWMSHLLAFMDALGLATASLVGNSFGGALSLAMATKHAHRINRLVLMGTPAGQFYRSASIGSSMHYEPSLENMRKLLESFPYDRSFVSPEMVKQRHELTLITGGTEAYQKLFPKKESNGEKQLVKAISEDQLANINLPILALHGREDKIIPPECSFTVAKSCPNADLHLFSKCGHWVQIEKQKEFTALTSQFLLQQ